MKLTIGYLYPELLNLYGDRGNLCCLQKRLSWRHLDSQILALSPGSPVDFSRLDLLVIGGGSDREMELACRYLPALRPDLKSWIEDGGVLLAICGGYQLLGTCDPADGSKWDSLEILDIHTQWQSKRLVQDTVIDSPFFSSPIIGFENHAGRTCIGDYTPLGLVRSGCGNTGSQGTEGLVYKNVLATYLHGPLLPKNPEVCDNLLVRALERRYGHGVCLEPLPDQQEKQANEYILRRSRHHWYNRRQAN